MDYCLCCLKRNNDTSSYHKSCLKKLFGVEKLPQIRINSTELISEINKNIGKMSISGAQIKASVKLNKEKNIIEIVQTGGTHILKPEPGEYPELPQNENICMNMAEVLGMDVPPHGLFYMSDKKICYIIRRFDRGASGQKVHVEDMAQLLDLPSDAKYESSLERIGAAILKYSRRPYLDLNNFLERAVFNFIIGNGDMHLKNWSLISIEGNYHLSPCYDFISSKLYLPDEDESALTLNGKRNRIRISDFRLLAAYLKIEEKSFENIIEKIRNFKAILLQTLDKDPSEFKRINQLKDIILERYKRLEIE
ncbi:MAG: HipA domain-containing protein [Cyanobacteria bacterium]|nr:HipA domain-containing protein [Cyanobacteriota bacterium]